MKLKSSEVQQEKKIILLISAILILEIRISK